jgi:hypothetical protein
MAAEKAARGGEEAQLRFCRGGEATNEKVKKGGEKYLSPIERKVCRIFFGVLRPLKKIATFYFFSFSRTPRPITFG